MRCILGMLITVIVAALTTTSPAIADSESFCGDRDAIVEKLNSEFAETRIGMGLGHDGQMVELFASRESGTWTMLVTFPTGQTCLSGTGEAWQVPMSTVRRKPQT